MRRPIIAELIAEQGFRSSWNDDGYAELCLSIVSTALQHGPVVIGAIPALVPVVRDGTRWVNNPNPVPNDACIRPPFPALTVETLLDGVPTATCCVQAPSDAVEIKRRSVERGGIDIFQGIDDPIFFECCTFTAGHRLVPSPSESRPVAWCFAISTKDGSHNGMSGVTIPEPYRTNPHGFPDEVLAKARDAFASAARYGVWVFRETMRLMNCKNVGLRPEPMQERSARKLAKRFDRQAACEYHVLTVRPGTGRPSVDLTCVEDTDGSALPLHVVRGHYKTFTADRPAFGRVAGTFYCPPHLRGDAETGISTKDYAVKEPRHDATRAPDAGPLPPSS